jgi:hypothetical protein
LLHPSGVGPDLVADALNPAQFRIAAIDFAHRQSRHLVLATARISPPTPHNRI